MVPPPKLTPVGNVIRSSPRMLEIDHHAQQEFVSTMYRTGEELEQSNGAIPAFREVKIDNIPLNTPGDRLWVHFSEDSTGRRNAVIQLMMNRALTEFRPTELGSGYWDAFSQGYKQPNDILSNSGLVATLDGMLPQKGVFNSIVDTPIFDEMSIPHLLNDGLYVGAAPREKAKRVIYTTDSSIAQGFGRIAMRGGTPIISPEFLSTVKTHLSLTEEDGTATHQLVTRANYDINGRQVQKVYEYTAKSNRRHYGVSGGTVSMSSKDGLSRGIMEDYAHHDQDRNEPIHSLKLGLDGLRTAYGLRKIYNR